MTAAPTGQAKESWPAFSGNFASASDGLYGPVELAMKTRKKCWIIEKSGKTLLSVLAGMSLALGTASAAGPATCQQPSNPFERGAARLMDRTPPECLPSETNNPVLRPLVEKWKHLPIESRRCPTIRSNHTVNLAVHIIRKAPGRPALVCLHGILADHLMWEYVAAALADDYEIWLVDLPGCGDSDAPKPSALEPDGYSLTAMGERVWQALRQCLAAEGSDAPRRLTLVGHSWGSSVIIRMLSAPALQSRYNSEAQRVDRAVLFAPCDLAINAVPPSFLKLLGLKGGLVAIGKCLGVFDAKVRDLTKRSFQDPPFATLERQQRYEHALSHFEHREAAKAMLLQAVPFSLKTGRPQWKEIDALVDDYANISAPVLIAYGTRDETLSAAMGNKLKDEIPGAMLVKVPRRGHALPTEDPLVCAELIQRFQQGRTPAELAAGLGVKIYPATAMLRSNPLLTTTAAPAPQTMSPVPGP